MKAQPRDWRRRLVQGLPGQLLRPLGYLPRSLPRWGFVALCNQLFAEALAAGELAFLDQRVLCIAIEDAGIDLVLTARGAQVLEIPVDQPADVTIRGTAYDLLLLVSRQEDADTLFFQRRLCLEGETELGLYVKNFLDAWEPPASVRFIQEVAAAGLSQLARFTDGKPLSSPTRLGPTNSRHKAPSA